MTKSLVFSLCFFLSFFCRAQKVVASLPAMNVIYIGLDNPLDIAVEGYSNKELTVTALGCSVSGNPNETMVVRASSPGRCQVTVSFNKDNEIIKHDFVYRIKKVPNPEARFGALKAGSYPAAALLGQNSIVAALPGFVFEGISYTVTSYKWKFTCNTKYMSCQGSQEGSKIPSQLKTIISKSNRGDFIMIDSIKCKTPSGAEEMLTPIVLFIETNKDDNEIDFVTHKKDKNSQISFHSYRPVFDCNQTPQFPSGVLKFYTIYSGDTQLVSEMFFSNSRVIYEKHYYLSGILFTEYNFKSNDTIGDAFIYYQNGKIKSKGSVVARKPNINERFLPPKYLSEESILIHNFIKTTYAPVGKWKGYYKNGKLALECHLKLCDPDQRFYSILEISKLNETQFNSKVIKYKIYSQQKQIISKEGYEDE